MPFDIGALAQETAGAGIGAIMGLALEGHNDRRQLRQQEKLQQQQIRGSKEMIDYQKAADLKMWKDTNYPEQIKQLEQAGLNPGLLYGMSGGGGVTTGGGAPGVGSGEAPKGGGEAITSAAMGMQLALMGAQKANIEADTEQKKVETEKTGGVDTDKVRTEINSLTQGITNQKVLEELGKVQTRLANMDAEIKGGTIKETIDKIVWESLKSLEELDQISRNNFISKATQHAQIDIVRRTAIGVLLKNALTSAETAKTGQETQNLEAERRNIQNKISMWAQDNYIQLMNMSNEQRRTAIGEQLKDSKVEMQGVSELINGISEILEGTFKRR